MNIAVLCGGVSKERDVSLSTGSGAARALRERGHAVALVDLFIGRPEVATDPLACFSTKDDGVFQVGVDEPDTDKLRASRPDGVLIGPGVLEICRAADIAFLALHGSEGENGKLQAFLDLYNIPYTGCGYLGSALAMDKEISKVLLRSAGVPVPPGISIHSAEEFHAETAVYPCVVKPCSGGSSVGTSIVFDEKDMREALAAAFASDTTVLVEQYIAGREFTVGIMDGKAMPVIEIIPKNGFYDYKNKYQAGMTEEICPAPISSEQTDRIQHLAEQAYSALHLETYARVDFLWGTDDVIYCLEANTLPGMTPTSLIPQMARQEGLSYGELCETIIRVSMKKYR